MGIFDRSQDKPDPTLDELAAQARGGDPQGALVAASTKLEGVAKRAGKESPAYAAQLFEHASLLLFLGMTERAVGAMRAASEIRGPRPEDEKARLTYLMNLGDTLAYAGHLDEAMTV